MTTKDLENLTPEQKRIKIAEACGWIRHGRSDTFWHRPNTPKSRQEFTLSCPIPDYLNDLNACAKMEQTLTPNAAAGYRFRLMQNSDGHKATHPTAEAALAHASATERCNAFLLTVG